MDDLLRRLPLDLLYIVANYDPQVLFMYPEKDLLQLNWIRLLKMNFHKDYKNSLFSNEELMRIYIYNSFSRRNQIACGRSEAIVINEDDTTVMNFNEMGVISDNNSHKNIACVAYGADYVIILLHDGTLLCRGSNTNGQLGLGDYASRDIFVKNETLGKDISIKQIACGYAHTLLLLTDGTLLTTGLNSSGQLGQKIAPELNSFTKLDNVKNIVQIACGYYHSVIKLEDGTLLGCGNNGAGQLGLDKMNIVPFFTKIKDLPKNISEISCGNCCTFLLIDDGTLMGCGYNESGALGLGDNKNRTTFTHIKNLPTNVVKIQAGYDHAICLLGNGNIMTCGHNRNGALGFPDRINRNIFEEIKNLPAKVKNIGTGGFAQYTLICLLNGTTIRFRN
ncbi:MAG: chromosome condensation regulator [Harvfovirus sp.]|uniref:Chromosome condensation regulator n=1 Tax=Harvfovirus sp. TaxID=2487768 RepID=A0A3G5A1Y9_9VIRU|nr:MAG: chromosome condensation regulator [Harvfovirus sp.]